MRRSNYFIPLLKETPAEAKIPSHRLMLRSGLICQETSGIYSWLPFGYRVLSKIEKIIENELDKIGCQRIIMPTIQPKELWQESGRYNEYGKELLKIKDRHNRDMVYGPTHEEVITDIGRQFIKSYKQLPIVLYQIHWKFRDEIRPRFGVMRGREFLMKDAYSFHISQEESNQFYEKMFNTYIKIFDKIFDNKKTVALKAKTGAIGGTNSHEFQIPADTGESELFFDKKYHDVSDRNYNNLKNIYSAADDMHDPNAISEKDLITKRGIELGHIFVLGDKYSKSMNLKVINKNGKDSYPYMGCFGIGLSRIVGSIIETSHDEKGIIWPKSITPFDIGLINLTNDYEKVDKIYNQLIERGVSVLYDDRKNISTGVKFAEMDLIGLPNQIIIGKKFKETNKLEIKNRKTGNLEVMSLDNFLSINQSAA